MVSSAPEPQRGSSAGIRWREVLYNTHMGSTDCGMRRNVVFPLNSVFLRLWVLPVFLSSDRHSGASAWSSEEEEKVQGSRRSFYHSLWSQEKDSSHDSGQDLDEEGMNKGGKLGAGWGGLGWTWHLWNVSIFPEDILWAEEWVKVFMPSASSAQQFVKCTWEE